MDPAQMQRSMDNVGQRAAASLVNAQRMARHRKTGKVHLYEMRALALVGECHELGCPPPVELIELLAFVFRDPKEQAEPIRIAGDDPGHLQRQFQQAIIRDGQQVKTKSVPAQRRAAEAEASRFHPEMPNENAFAASENSVANAAGVARSTIRRWRDRPDYRLMVEHIVAKGGETK